MPAGPIPPEDNSKRQAQDRRRARLAGELRSNLRKRKAQARGRALQEASGLAHEEDGQEHQPDAREAANGDRRGPTGEVA